MFHKTAISVIALIALILTNPTHAITWDGGYHLFDSGFEDEVGMINAATADITGGYIAALVLYDICSATIDGGSLGNSRAFGASSFDIYSGSIVTLHGDDSSHLNIYGGFIEELDPEDDNTTNLYVESYNWDPDGGNWNGGLITGIWFDSGESFSIELVSEGDFNYLTFVPEPGSISLILPGSLVLIKRKQ
ncbi:MAG: hypothetical protein J7M30_06720 [Deltaproteobacteria bacterium]|nr:hypothetical protein [Deltaproteobacteria bacterium]